MVDVERYKRGGVWWYIDDTDKHKAERGLLRGSRPVIIISGVSNPTGNCTITFAPISHMKSREIKGPEALHEMFAVPICIKIRDTDDVSYVACNQIEIGLTSRFRGYVGQVSQKKLAEIEAEIKRYLQFDTKPEEEPESEIQNILYKSDTSKSEDLKSNTKVENGVNSEVNSSEDIKDGTRRKSIKHKYFIKCLNNGVKYTSQKAAALDLGISRSAIYRSLNGLAPNSKWKFQKIERKKE